jgi:group I intron endonuclease
MNVGIYKITSPSGKTYIGQATNIEKRWKYYKKITCSDQPRLYNSLTKYGWEQHIFQILERCALEQLDEKEIFHKQLFINEFGWRMALFCQLIDGKGGHRNKETKEKISIANKGKKQSKETCLKKAKSLAGRIESDITRNKKSKSNMGISRGKGIPKSKEHILKTSKSLCKPVLQYDLKGNFIKEWEGSIEVRNTLHLDINSCLNGKAKTSGGYIWRKKIDPLPLNFDLETFLIKKDTGLKKPMSEQHKQNIGASLKGRKCIWNTRPK